MKKMQKRSFHLSDSHYQELKTIAAEKGSCFAAYMRMIAIAAIKKEREYVKKLE